MNFVASLSSSSLRIQLYPFLFVCLSVFILYLAHIQSSKSAGLYFDEDDTVGVSSMLTRNKDELELIEDDENTFTGDQTDADDDADGESGNNSNMNYQNQILLHTFFPNLLLDEMLQKQVYHQLL